MFLVSSHLLLFLSFLAQSRAQTTMLSETTTDTTTADPTTTLETTTETTTTTPETTTTTPETTTETTTTTPETTTETTTTTPETTTETTTTTPETTTQTTTTTPETTPETTTTTPETTTETTTTIPETTTTTPETTTETTTTTPETTITTLETTTETTTTTPETTTETTTTTPETTTETTTTTPETTTETTTTTPETTTETTTTTPETTTTTPETTTETTTTIPETTTTTPETTTDTTTTTPETTTEETTTIALTTAWTAPAIFYPFGSAAGDSGQLETGLESYEHVAFSTPFTYFNRKYSSIWVNYNGLLTFNQSFPETDPIPFPTNGTEDYIAVLWTDLDDIGFGNYWFHEYTNGSVLDRASRDINQYFPNRGFAASWVFVVTWDYVLTRDINALNLRLQPAITFQAVLISGGGFSFILMNYGDCAGIYFPVEAGYDTINSTDYYVIHYDYSTGYSISNLKNTTNVNVPGRWAFLVNNGTENIIGLQMKLRSFLDLTQTENINGVLQLIKEELVHQGMSSSIGVKIRKVQKTWP